MGNLNIPADQWLKELFECEYCAECGHDERHHTAVPLSFMDNWFARCDDPIDESLSDHEAELEFERRIAANEELR